MQKVTSRYMVNFTFTTKCAMKQNRIILPHMMKSFTSDPFQGLTHPRQKIALCMNDITENDQVSMGGCTYQIFSFIICFPIKCFANVSSISKYYLICQSIYRDQLIQTIVIFDYYQFITQYLWQHHPPYSANNNNGNGM